MLATSLITYCTSFVSFSGWLPSFLEHRETQDWLKPGGSICLHPNPSPLATRQAPSIRVRHTGHAAHYILHISRALLWLAAYLPRMPLEHKETQDCLRPGGPTCVRPDLTPHHTTTHIYLSDGFYCKKGNYVNRPTSAYYIRRLLYK
uniref:Secreted protein n=1 Tax=Mesocestoides corti TaxID=53468 RepID=A0A5K3FL37_MESCO